MKYKIADIVVDFDAKYDMLKSHAEKYMINTNEAPEIQVTDQEMNDEKIAFYHSDNKDLPVTEGLEYQFTGNVFNKKLINFNGCFLHSSAVVVDGEAYLFSAPCETGKSTHASLWLKYLEDKKPYIINDDKPALRIIDDEIYVYGTPFSGKHNISENTRAKLKGICFIEQSPENFIRKIDSKESFILFLKQTTYMLNSEEMGKLLGILDIIISKTPIYQFGCNISEDAVKLSYGTMKGEIKNES